jgi:hypothetical protein
MSETWTCSQCKRPVPAECDGKCGQGTWSGRVALAALLAVAVTLGAAGCRLADSPTGSGTGASTGSDVPFSAECDAHDQPVHVRPATAEARRAAARMCAETGSEVANAPWPSGWHPVPGGEVAQR